MVLNLFLALVVIGVTACDLGTYSSGGMWVPWHSSWRSCTGGGSCESWEEYMYLNETSGVCEFWPSGEFYEGTLVRDWVDWEGTCFGLWYQESCIKCPSGEALDLDTLTCIANWDSNKKEVSDSSNFNFEKFWRSSKFYIDPSYEGHIEMGTMNHPYRTILPALDEILLHFSNSESEVEILLKEGTTTYIEDSKALIINIKHLIIQTYNDTSSPAGYATLCTIDQPQEKISLKAVIHLIKNITVDIDSIISGQGFTENELQQIGKSGANFEVIRSSITMNQLIIRRIASSTTSGQFMFLIYLQNRTMSLSKKSLLNYS